MSVFIFCVQNSLILAKSGGQFLKPNLGEKLLFAPFRRISLFFYNETRYYSFSTHFSFYVIKKPELLLFDAFRFSCPKKQGNAPFRRISPEKVLFDAFHQKNSFSTHLSFFSRKCSFSTHFSRKTPFRRISPEKLLFDAFLRKNSFSTHFSKKAPFRRISPEKLLFDAFLQKNSFSTHFSTKNTFSIIHQTNHIF